MGLEDGVGVKVNRGSFLERMGESGGERKEGGEGCWKRC